MSPENRKAMSTAKSIVFVLGSTRSGTSAIRQAIAGTRYRGAGEGHVAGLVSKLHDAVTAYYGSHKAALEQGTLLARIPESDWHERINLLFRRVIERNSPGEFILDKTPTIEPLQALQHIEAIWPDAKFAFCRRRGIDNVLSKQRKWPDRPFENHCREWAAVNDLWDEKKKNLHSSSIEVDYFDLLNDVQGVAKRVGMLLALTEDEVGVVANRLRATRAETTSKGPGFVRFSDTGWSTEQSSVFTRICGPTMERSGYGLSDYWQTPRSK